MRLASRTGVFLTCVRFRHHPRSTYNHETVQTHSHYTRRRVALRAECKSGIEAGSSAHHWRKPGVDGKKYTLKNFADAKILAVVLTCNHCPTAQAYEQRLFDLQRDYSGKGVAIVAISPNDPHALRLDELGYSEYGDSFEEMKLRASERKFPFPYLYDGDTQTVATA